MSADGETSQTRPTAHATGLTAESRAASFLTQRGFQIVARRFRSGAGEIDIIAANKHLLIFVEVKARGKLDDAAYAISDRQKMRIVASAEAWLATHPAYAQYAMRFDAVLVAPGRAPRHIPNAFDASP